MVDLWLPSTVWEEASSLLAIPVYPTFLGASGGNKPTCEEKWNKKSTREFKVVNEENLELQLAVRGTVESIGNTV